VDGRVKPGHDEVKKGAGAFAAQCLSATLASKQVPRLVTDFAHPHRAPPEE
jgi:hypothetical protein